MRFNEKLESIRECYDVVPLMVAEIEKLTGYLDQVLGKDFVDSIRKYDPSTPIHAWLMGKEFAINKKWPTVGDLIFVRDSLDKDKEKINGIGTNDGVGSHPSVSHAADERERIGDDPTGSR